MIIDLGDYEEKDGCLFCGTMYDLNRHHMDYKNDITINLCKTCHGDFHEENYYDKKNHVFIRRKKRVRLESLKRILDK